MKKLLGILVLGLLWCNTSFADYNSIEKSAKESCKVFAYEPGSKLENDCISRLVKIRMENLAEAQNTVSKSQSPGDCAFKDHNCNWYKYTYLPPVLTKIWGVILSGEYAGVGNWIAGEEKSLDEAIDFFHNEPYCKAGMCKVTYIGDKMISDSKQLQIAKRYYESNILSQYFPQFNQTQTTSAYSSQDTQISQNSVSKNNTSQAKKICLELGFTAGTEKFADCALQMLTMNQEDESQTEVVTTSSQDQEYTFTGDATFGTKKKSKRHNKKVAKYMKMPEKWLCIGYINKYGIFKKAKQAARAEAIQTRRIDCNPYMDAAYYDKQERKMAIADATQKALDSNAESKRAIADSVNRNRNNNLRCTTRKSGSYTRTTCY